MLKNLFNRFRTTIKNISYSVIKTTFPDGTVKEQKVLNHGGSADTPEEIKEVEQKMERAMKNMDKAFETLDQVFKDF